MDSLANIIIIIEQAAILFCFFTFLTQTYKNTNLILKKKLLILLFSSIFSIGIQLLKPNISFLIYLVLIIPLFLLYKYILKYDNGSTIISILVLYLTISISEILSYFSLKLLVDIKVAMITSSIYIFSLYHLLKILYYSFLLFVEIRFLKDVMDKEINILESLNKKDISIATLIILNIIIPNVLNFRINAIEHNLNMLSFTVIQLSIVLSLIYVCFKYINCFVESQSELHQEKIYNKTLVELVDSLRLLKHDYNNILQAINGYIITKQYDQLDEHIKRLSKDSKNISKVEAINPEIINQPAIYGIIGAKYFRAVNKNIDFSLSINTNISEISFDFTELSRILGILLDNAIEASEKSDNPHISIKFSYNKFKQADMIEIKNTIAKNSKIDLNKIFNKGVSSKTIKSGLGLWEVKKIISSKSNSQIFADVNNNEFSQTIIVEKN